MLEYLKCWFWILKDLDEFVNAEIFVMEFQVFALKALGFNI
jgi:hypothetical protein